jgi:hypothetical protein
MKIINPVFIIGCPRSGTTLLFTILHSSKELWSSYKESHYVWEKFLPDKRDPMFSVYLDEKDYTEGDRKYIENKYHEHTYNSALFAKSIQFVFFNKFKTLLKPFFMLFLKLTKFCKSLFLKEYRIIDKTPPNTYRISYLKKVFPDAKFIYITRDGMSNISSLIEGWRSNKRFNFGFRKFHSYNSRIHIKGYEGKVWKFTNPPGWESYLDKSLEEVCAFQWLSAHKYSLESFAQMSPDDYLQIKYEDLIAGPQAVIQKICKFINIDYTGKLKEYAEHPPVVSTSSKPDPNKWKKNQELIEHIKPIIEEMQTKLTYSPTKETKLSKV